MAKRFSFDHPDDAIRALAESLTVTSVESRVAECNGRVLAVDIVADRHSPAADVSAMDGYAIRLSDLQTAGDIPVQGQCVPGAPPPTMPESGVLRIFTGAIVPTGCDAVVKREDTVEADASIRLTDAAHRTSVGDHIRKAGENAKAAGTVVAGGTLVDSAVRATMTNFGAAAIDVHAHVGVTVMTTGDEVISLDDNAIQPWQLRNSNQTALCSMLSQHPWVQLKQAVHCQDDRQRLAEMLRKHLEQSDAIILTGGVSMGDYDYVPDIVKEVGGQILFHGLPIRPGKPILGAATSDGKLILGLPGNPVSATVGCRRFGIPLLAKISGNKNWRLPCPVVRLDDAGDKTIPLHWMRLVRLRETGIAEPVMSQGSGDLVSLGQSTGFVEIPPNQSGEGPWPYRSW
tara:strand:+ start:54226 stop:55428 length:1203 start_codon:yes stop_codon:yes gene_type:complete